MRLLPLNGFKPSSKIFYRPFQGGTSFYWSFIFFLYCVYYVFVCVCLYLPCGHLLGKGWPLGSRLWCLLWVCHFPIGILDQVWYLIASIPDLCTLTYFVIPLGSLVCDCLLSFCHFHMWCPGSGVVLDCIDSWYVPSSLLFNSLNSVNNNIY